MAIIDLFFGWLDKQAEQRSRHIAQTTGRRELLAKIGTMLVGGTVLPLLPFDRTSGQAWAADDLPADQDESKCEYWRYCALDGSLCNDCGGTLTQCPPGSEASKVSWVGTCRNPQDGKDYLVSYNDCCGKAVCGGAHCYTSKGERPGYRMGLHNDVNWCMANASKGYHCTVALVVGLADA